MDFDVQSQKAEILKGLAHPVRLSIVEMLARGEMCVCEIAECFDSDRTTVSKHLAVLRTLGILHDRKEGLKVIYSLALPCLLGALRCAESLVRHGNNAGDPFSAKGCCGDLKEKEEGVDA